MEQAELQPLYDSYHRKIAKIDLHFKRYLYSQINWKARIISIKGARGVGKTTLLLQHILENYEDIDQTLYVHSYDIDPHSYDVDPLEEGRAFKEQSLFACKQAAA